MFRTHGRTDARTHKTAAALIRASVRLCVCASLLTGCTTLDRAVGTVPWFTTMRDQPSVRPFEGPADPTAHQPYFLPPEGSIPVTGREDSLDIYSPAGLKVVDGLRNPVHTTDTLELVRGARIFRTYCAVCHGPEGKGNGPVSGKFGYVPDLTQDMTKARSDGYIYAILRHGRGLMPRYGDRIRDQHDRWLVVNHVRRLQGMGQ